MKLKSLAIGDTGFLLEYETGNSTITRKIPHSHITRMLTVCATGGRVLELHLKSKVPDCVGGVPLRDNKGKVIEKDEVLVLLLPTDLWRKTELALESWSG